MAQPGFWRNLGGRLTDAVLPGHQYNADTGRFQNIGRGFAGLGTMVGAGYLGGPGAQQLIKGRVQDWVDKYSDPGRRQIEGSGLSYTSPGSLQGGGGSYGDFGGLNPMDTTIHMDPGGNTGIMPPSAFGGGGGWQGGTFGGPGYTGGGQNSSGNFDISQTTLGPGPGFQSDFGSLNPAITNINTGSGSGAGSSGGGDPSQSAFGGRAGTGGGAFGNYGGGNTNFAGGGGGTLGSGSVVDPSQWGALGLGGDSGPQSGGIGPGYFLQMMSGGMHEPGGGSGGGGGIAGGSMAAKIAALRGGPHPMTGGGGQVQPAGNTGIVPPGMIKTGGGAPVSMIGALRRRPPIIPPPGGRVNA